MEKTGSLSDEPFRDCRDDAVLEGIASTGRLAPNRALSLCTEVKVTKVEFCAKFGRCSLSGLEVRAFLVFARNTCLWLLRKRDKNWRCSRTDCPISLRVGQVL